MLESKIKNLNQLKKIVDRLKKSRKRIVFTNGCFDILHYGHVKCLEAAKEYGDYLIVAVNSDISVKRLKGNTRPVFPSFARARTIAALESVDFVTIFKEDTPLNLIKKIKPDILVKGADWESKDIVGKDVLASYGAKVITIPLVKNFSTTGLIKTIEKRFIK